MASEGAWTIAELQSIGSKRFPKNDSTITLCHGKSHWRITTFLVDGKHCLKDRTACSSGCTHEVGVCMDKK